MKRRLNGDGSITRRKNGTYQINIWFKGTRKSFYGKTEKEVREKLRKFQVECYNGVIISDITVGEFIEWWLKSVKKDRIKPASYDRIEQTYLRYIKDDIGDTELKKLTAAQCQDLINKQSERLAYSTTKKIHELLNSSLNYALDSDYIVKNPMKLVSVPREASFNKKTKEVIIPSDEDLRRFFEVAETRLPNGRALYTPSYVSAYRLIIQTGMRIGEVLALTWDKVSFEDRTIYINASVSEVIDRESTDGHCIKRIITEPKTKSGERKIAVSDATLQILNDLRAMYAKQGFDTMGYVLLNSKGKPASCHDVSRSMKNICKAAGIKALSPHVFRHYFASKCVANGIDFVTLARHLGHSRPSVTMNIYSHVTNKQSDALRELLEAM